MDHTAKTDNVLTVYVADDFRAAAERLKSVTLRILLSQPATIEARLNGTLLPAPMLDDGWSEFAAKPSLYAVGDNLISIRSTKPQPESDTSIEKVEVHVAYQ